MATLRALAKCLFIICFFYVASSVYALELHNPPYSKWPLQLTVDKAFIINGVITHIETDSCIVIDHFSSKDRDILQGRFEAYLPKKASGDCYKHYKREELLLKLKRARLQKELLGGPSRRCPATRYYIAPREVVPDSLKTLKALSVSYFDKELYPIRDTSQQLFGHEVVIIGAAWHPTTDTVQSLTKLIIENDSAYLQIKPSNTEFLQAYSVDDRGKSSLITYYKCLTKLDTLNDYQEKKKIASTLVTLPIFMNEATGYSLYLKMLDLNFPKANLIQKKELKKLHPYSDTQGFSEEVFTW